MLLEDPLRCLALHDGSLSLLYGCFSRISCGVSREFIGSQPCLFGLLLLHRLGDCGICRGFGEAERALYQLA